jgi:hypothetical protein
MALSDILSRYAGSPQPHADTGAHFDQAAAAAPDQLGAALSSMFRSDATPPFAQIVGNLFNNSDPQQRAGVLNQIVQALGPAAAGAGAGGILGQILGGGAAAPAAGQRITPEQASQLSPDDVTKLATHAEQHNPSVVDALGSFYAQHPTLVKSLGGMALAVALGHLRK